MAAVTRREYVGGAAATTLSSSISNSTTTIPVTSGTGWPTGAGGPFYIVVGRGTATEEKILCDSRSGDTITANASGRGVDDTSAAAHDSGATVEHVWTAQDADDVNKVAAALTTKGDLLGFSTEPARVPVGTDDQVLVANSGDAEGVAWKALTLADAGDLGTFMANVEVDGSTEVATASLTASYANAATVDLTIPAAWSGWKCFVVATLITTGSSDLDFRLSIDGTAQQAVEGVNNQPTSIVGRRTGMATTGSRTIALQGKTNTAGGSAVDIALYARAVRTS